MKYRIAKLFLLSLTIGAVIVIWNPLKSSSQSNGKSFAPDMEWRATHAPAGAKYVGNKTCAECHSQNETQGATTMAKALEMVAECSILQSNPQLNFKSGIYSYSIERQNTQSIYSVTDGKETISALILYALGQGKAGQTYVLERNGKYYETRVSFYNDIKGLDFTLGSPRGAAKSLEEAFGRIMDSLDTKDCFSCHSTAPVSEGKLQLDKMTPGITCEGCHGAGEKHVTLMKTKPKIGAMSHKAILNPGHFDTEGQSQFCGSCHRTWAQVQLMKAQGVVNVRFQPYRIFGSKCYDFDDKRISCTACHDPHDNSKRPANFYDSKCIACHQQTKPEQKLKMSPVCKAGKIQNCASCHMPDYEIPGSHHKFSDHQIRIVRAGEPYPN